MRILGIVDRIKSLFFKKKISIIHTDITYYPHGGRPYQIINQENNKLIRYFNMETNEWSEWKVVKLKDSLCQK